MENKILLEEELYMPIRDYLVKKGFNVKGEVGNCDLFAVKDDCVLIVEFKKSLTVDLLIQAANRQKIADNVYIAIPKPKARIGGKKWNDICHLIKRLELGFIVVTKNKKNFKVEVLCEPVDFDRQKSRQNAKKKRQKLLQEFNNRKFDVNVGGSVRKKILTVYREQAISIALYLEKNGPTTANNLSKSGLGQGKTHSILYNNFYGWFERVERGIYDLTSKGRNDLKSFQNIINKI